MPALPFILKADREDFGVNNVFDQPSGLKVGNQEIVWHGTYRPQTRSQKKKLQEAQKEDEAVASSKRLDK